MVSRLYPWLTTCSVMACLALPAYAQEQQGPTPETMPGAATAPQPTSRDEQAPPAATGPASVGLADIIVTARKTAENLQTVPVAVTSVSGADMARQSIRSLSDIQTTAPNLRIRPSNANPSSALVTIRGQSQNDTVATLDPAVGTYVDGVYWARSVGLNVNVVDIATAEILRGPQGTLFGRNTTGGAINITTNAPRLDRWEGSAAATIGNYGTLNLAGVLNVPLGSTLSVRFAAQHAGNDGFGRNIRDGRRTDNIRTSTLRGKLLWQPGSMFDLTLGYERFQLDGTGPGQKLVFASATSPANTVIRLQSGGTDTLANYLYTGTDLYRSNVDSLVPAYALTRTAYATANLRTGIGDFKATGAWRTVYNRYTLDFDGTPYQIGTSNPTVADTTQWSGELQWTNTLFDGRLKYIAGYYYFDEHGTDQSTTYVLAALNPVNNPNRPYGRIGAVSNAGYGQATLKITDALSVTGGLRYTDDRKSFSSRTRNGFDTAISRCLVPTIVRPDPNVCYGVFPELKYNKINYLATVDYRFTRDIFAYARTASGYRGGGYNLRGAVNPVVGPLGTYTPFGPETVTDYEIGLKSELFDRHVRLNIALFYDKFNDVQRTTVIGTPTGSVATYATNAAKATVKGIEVEAIIIPVEHAQLGFNGGYTDAGYERYQDPILGDLKDADFPNTPKYTASVYGQYIMPLAFGDLLVRADYNYTSRVNFTGAPANVGGVPLAFYTSQKGYGLLNLRAGVTLADGMLEIAAFGTNVLGKKYTVSAHEFVTSGLGLVNRIPGRPATFGVDLKVNFR